MRRRATRCESSIGAVRFTASAVVPKLALEIFGAAGRRHARIVDEDIDVAEFRARGFDDAIDVGLDSDIGADAERADAIFFRELIGQLLASIGAARDQHHIGARERQRMRAFDAQSRRRAGHQPKMAAQSKQ